MDEVRIKICGLTRAPDARIAGEAGAHYLGVILAEGFGRSLDPTRAQGVLQDVEGAVRVTVRVDDTYDRIMRDAEALGARVVQLHGREAPEEAARIRDTGCLVWKAVRVRSAEDVADAVARFEGSVDGFLLDGWHPERVGGTGTSFAWGDVSAAPAQIPEGSTFIAAGGLDPGNVGEAVRVLRPDVVDVSSGVESSPGEKDSGRIEAFVRAVREAKLT